MSITISIIESQLLEAAREFLLGVAPAGWQVVKAQANRVAMPKPPFIEMTSLTKTALATPIPIYAAGAQNPGSVGYVTKTKWLVQLDFYGPGAGDTAKILADLVRTPYACDQFTSSGIDMQPLYAEDPRNTTLVNAEMQYEERWTVDVLFQFNPSVAVPQDFATQLQVGLVEVDTTYPPQE